MDDLFGVIIVIIALFGVISEKRKKKASQMKKASTTVDGPYAGNAAAQSARSGNARAGNEARFETEMQGIKERAERKLEKKKAAERERTWPSAEEAARKVPREDALRTAMESAPEGADPCHDMLYTTAAVGAMEGVDPCHDGLYRVAEPETQEDAYAVDMLPEENSEAARELFRGVILSEILKRHSGGWRARHL